MRHLTFIISLGNRQPDIDRLIWGLTELAANYAQDTPLNLGSMLPWSGYANDPRKSAPERLHQRVLTEMIMTPRQADRSPQRRISIDRSIGQISAESICPYPPGIPVLIPGEIITAEVIDYLQQIFDLGGELTGGSDPKLETIKVVDRSE
jgi:arginine decarboxylase